MIRRESNGGITVSEPTKPTETEIVQCEVCLKEVPLSEAHVPEAVEYVAHFCGLDCYDQWKKKGESASGSWHRVPPGLQEI